MKYENEQNNQRMYEWMNDTNYVRTEVECTKYENEAMNQRMYELTNQRYELQLRTLYSSS